MQQKKILGEVEELSLAKRDDFAEGYPEVNKWMSDWSIDDETMAELINFVNENDNHLDAAKEWVQENRELTEEWVN